MQSVYRWSTLFTVWSYSEETVEIRLCGHKYRTYTEDGRWEDRKDGHIEKREKEER